MTNTLENLRQSIDHLDAALMFILAERTHALVKVGIIKKRDHLDFSYSDERAHDLQKIMAMAEAQHINAQFLQDLFQLLYQEASHLMQSHHENESADNFVQALTLDSSRTTLYNLDVTLCHLLAERFHVAAHIGHYKRQHQLQPISSERWKKVLQTKIDMGLQLGIEAEFVTLLMNRIHEESLRLQTA